MPPPYAIRSTRREDWRELRGLRLAALADPAAPVAFTERYDKATALPREEWEKRAAGGDRGTFIGEDPTGRWMGMLSVFSTPLCVRVVGVYVRPEARGSGLAGALMRRAAEWANGRELRLHVHEHNERAARFYASFGFRPTGATDTDPRNPALRAYELAYRPRQDGPGPGPAVRPARR